MFHLLKMLDGSDMKSGLPKPMLSSLSEGSRADKKGLKCRLCSCSLCRNVHVVQNLVIFNLLYPETWSLNLCGARLTLSPSYSRPSEYKNSWLGNEANPGIVVVGRKSANSIFLEIVYKYRWRLLQTYLPFETKS
jgi:hypothetical protein